MSKDLTVREPAPGEVAVTANSAAAVPHMQAGLLEWARKKLPLVEAEADELERSYQIAVENGFRRDAFLKAAQRGRRLVEYYRKIMLALEAGYMIFPPTGASVFAVRTNRNNPKLVQIESGWETPTTAALVLPAGEGRYVDDDLDFSRQKEERKNAKGEAYMQTVTYSEGFKEDIEFPLEMRKPEILQATATAMEALIFDELGVAPAEKRPDPVIVGNVIHPVTKARVSFLISWYVDTRSI